MKIAVILFGDYIYDGRVQRISRILSSKYDVRVFGISDNNSKKYPKVFDGVNIEIIKLKTKDLPKNQFFQIFKFIEYIIVTTNQINKFNPDVLHCNDVFTLFFGWFFKFKKKKFVYDSHELWMDSSHKYLYNAKLFVFLRWLERVTIRKTNAVITVGKNIAQILHDRYNIPAPVIIMNISDVSKIADSNIIREKLNLPKKCKIVLYIGGFIPGRGLEKVVESCQYWNNNVVLVLLGKGVLEKKLEEMIEKYSIKSKIYFVEHVPQEQVLKYTSSCDAGIIPYQNICLNHYYCLPNKFFLYTLLKKPVLASNFPDMGDLIKEYNLGFIFNPENPKDIAEQVNKMFDMKYKIKSEDFYKFSCRFNLKNENKKMLDLYKKLET